MEFANLDKPTVFGNEYLTYILWAISPEGRAINLGEVLVRDNNRSKLDATDVSATASAIDVPVYSFVVTSAIDRPEEVLSESGAVVIFHYIIQKVGSPEIIHWGQELSFQRAKECVEDFLESHQAKQA